MGNFENTFIYFFLFSKVKSRAGRDLDVEAIKTLQTEITKLEHASKDTTALDEYIDSTQAYSNTSTDSRTPTVTLVTDSVQKTLSNLGNYFDNVDKHLDLMRIKLGEFKEAVFQRCEQYSGKRITGKKTSCDSYYKCIVINKKSRFAIVSVLHTAIKQLGMLH